MAHAIELSSRDSIQILDNARRAGSQVRVHPKSWPESQHIMGQLVDGPDRTVEVDIARDLESNLTYALTCYCQINLDLPEGQYFFDSHIVSVRNSGSALRLSLGWPQTILVLQRRSTGRSFLARPSTVHISRAEDGLLSSFEGRLYNLSPSGLAFKIPAPCAEQIKIGQVWSVCFEIPEQQQTYRLEGTVRRRLPSSSQADAIVGVHFDAPSNDPADLDLLREFLTHRGRSGAAVGGTP